MKDYRKSTTKHTNKDQKKKELEKLIAEGLYSPDSEKIAKALLKDEEESKD